MRAQGKNGGSPLHFLCSGLTKKAGIFVDTHWIFSYLWPNNGSFCWSTHYYVLPCYLEGNLLQADVCKNLKLPIQGGRESKGRLYCLKFQLLKEGLCLCVCVSIQENLLFKSRQRCVCGCIAEKEKGSKRRRAVVWASSDCSCSSLWGEKNAGLQPNVLREGRADRPQDGECD